MVEKENTQARRLNDMMHEYWDGRAGGFGFDTKNDTMDDMKARIAPQSAPGSWTWVRAPAWWPLPRRFWAMM